MGLSAHLQMADGEAARHVLQEINPAATFVVLDENFTTQDPGEAAEHFERKLT